MLESFPIVLSIAALLISVLTAWLTFFRRGSLHATQPTTVFFGPDGPNYEKLDNPKLFLRTLIFSTGKRGLMIESLHVKLTRNETVQNFNIWVYGDTSLKRGSGLFVGESGIVTNHHFLTPRDGTAFSFVEGNYQIKLYAKILSSKTQKLLWSETLSISKEQAEFLAKGNYGVYFDWGPDSKNYSSHLERKPINRT